LNGTSRSFAWRTIGGQTIPPKSANELKQLADRLDEDHAFVKGQFVAWKPGLKNRKFPDYGEPSIVTAVLPSPVFDPSETAGSPYFQEPLTIVIGNYRADELLEYRVDGRRFEPVEE
jgi:hypothetical protein